MSNHPHFYQVCCFQLLQICFILPRHYDIISVEILSFLNRSIRWQNSLSMQPACNCMVFRWNVFFLECIERERCCVRIKQLEELVNAALQNLDAWELEGVEHWMVPVHQLMKLIIVRNPHNLRWFYLFFLWTFFARWIIYRRVWLRFFQGVETFICDWQTIRWRFFFALWFFVSLHKRRPYCSSFLRFLILRGRIF